MVPSQCVRMVAYTQSMTDCDWGTRSKCIRIISKQMNAHSHTHTRTINSIKINLNFKEYEWKCKLNAYNFCGVWVLLFSYCVCNTNFVYICRPRVIIYVLCRINNKNNHKTYTFQSHQNNSLERWKIWKRSIAWCSIALVNFKIKSNWIEINELSNDVFVLFVLFFEIAC